MTAQQKKQTERAMLLGLMRRLDIAATLLPGDFESPDLAIELNGNTIGVEVTEVQKSSDERARRAPKDAVVEKCKAEFESHGGSPLSVCFTFCRGAKIGRSNHSTICQQVVDLLLAAGEAEEFEVRVIKADRFPHPLNEKLSELRFWREPRRGIWQCMEATWVAPLTAKILQERIDAKSALLPVYRSKGYDAYWLLICAHPTNPACQFEVARDFQSEEVRSPFDRTFFFNGWQVLELAQAKPS